MEGRGRRFLGSGAGVEAVGRRGLVLFLAIGLIGGRVEARGEASDGAGARAGGRGGGADPVGSKKCAQLCRSFADGRKKAVWARGRTGCAT